MTLASTASVQPSAVPAEAEPRAAVFPARGQLPVDLIAIPAWAGQESAPVKICVLCRRTPDPVEGYLPQRRDLLDAKVFLGCLTDAHGVLDLLEIWVQSTDGLAEAARSRVMTHDAVDNAVLDRRWRQLYDVAVADWPGGLIGCGYETRNPPPTFLDVEQGIPVHPQGWALCRDDDVLRGAGLPPYGGSIHRYLTRTGSGEGGDGARRFVPVTPEAPRNESTFEYDDTLPPDPKRVPFNPGGGLVLVKPAGHLKVQEIADVLGGKRFDGTAAGAGRLRFAPVRSLAGPGGGFMFPGEGTPTPSRLVETFLLKLQVWTGMVAEVARLTAAAGRPLLNLGPSSFAVRVDDAAPHLPALWTAAVQLTDPGDAIPLALPQGDTKYHFCLPGRSVQTSIYQPAAVARGTVSGFGQLYLSGSTDAAGGKVFDGLLTVADPIRPTARDVIRVRVPVVGRRVDLYVKVLPDQNPSPTQLRVRSVSDDRLAPFQDAVAGLIGVPLQEVAFEHYPLFGSAADVYSLAVLGVDLLLTPPDGNHAEPFRDLLVLAGRCREVHAPGTSTPERVASVVAAHADALRGLGPHLLVAPGPDPQLALRALTPELWWATVATLVRMLPGLGPDSLLADLGDTVPPSMGAAPTLAGIYEVLLPDLRRLAGRARSLLFGEWGGNRLIGGLLDELRPARPKP